MLANFKQNSQSMIYQLIDTILERHDADVDAAEAHGIAIGMLCVDERVQWTDWFSELFKATPDLSALELDALEDMFEKTRTLLNADSFEFQLFLPDDESMLMQQVEALRSWCEGFLLGIGYRYTSSVWPGDSGEILKDIVEFTKLDSKAIDEEDEQAFTEINEYLRAAILLLRDDLRGNRRNLH